MAPATHRRVATCRPVETATLATVGPVPPPDQFHELADSLTGFVDAWDQLVGAETILPDSPAAIECANEPWADEWGTHPYRDTWAEAHLVSKGDLTICEPSPRS